MLIHEQAKYYHLLQDEIKLVHFLADEAFSSIIYVLQITWV